ncbi:hypothetical protein [Nocardiopsis chromatogenes]
MLDSDGNLHIAGRPVTGQKDLGYRLRGLTGPWRPRSACR